MSYDSRPPACKARFALSGMPGRRRINLKIRTQLRK